MLATDLRWAICLSTILFATCDRIALTASQSMIPSVGARYSLATANSVVFFFMQLGSLAAAALTGVLLHVSTPTSALTAIASTFAISVCCMCLVRRERLSPQDTCDTTGSALLVDARLLRLGAIYALLYTGGISISVIGPSFVYEELAGHALDFGQLESAWSAGSILGAILFIPLVRAFDIPILQMIILALTALSFATLRMLDLPWVLLAFAMLGALYNLGRVVVEVTLQSSVPRANLGRAKGALHCTGVFLGLILFAIGAAVSDTIRPSTMFLVFAGILAVGTIALTIFRVDLDQKNGSG